MPCGVRRQPSWEHWLRGRQPACSCSLLARRVPALVAVPVFQSINGGVLCGRASHDCTTCNLRPHLQPCSRQPDCAGVVRYMADKHTDETQVDPMPCGSEGPATLLRQLLCVFIGQGLAALSSLVDDGAPDGGTLAGAACASLWAALQAGGPAALVPRCRACAAARLPLRLVLLLTRLARQPVPNGATPRSLVGV